MRSIRTKTTLLTVCAIVVTMSVATLLGALAIRDLGSSDSERLLELLCETGQKNLNSYFEGMEHSAEVLSSYVEQDLEHTDINQLQDHVDRVREFFEDTVYRTHGVLTYYYRIDPAVSKDVAGFWYVNLDGRGFREHTVTDISAYDTTDTSSLVWFTVPKMTGQSMWQPPYVTENLDVRVISYNVPVFKGSTFVGVVGIEIDYSTIANLVSSIKLYENGYAFVNDDEGTIIYHPLIDVTTLSQDQMPKVPDGLMGDQHVVTYSFAGVQKKAVWLPLSNDMRLNVTVPISEINASWQQWVNEILLVSLVLLLVFVAVTLRFTGHITKPLRELTAVAQQVNEGDFDFTLQYDEDDEVGILTRAFGQLLAYLRTYISDLNNLAFSDALTSLHNKGAFDIHAKELQDRLLQGQDPPEFAICMFDCNDLKYINDHFGHDKGNIYLKSCSALICEVFDHSPVFRMGGDEFAAILQGRDYANRDTLLAQFDEASLATRTQETKRWKQIDLARGMAVYDPHTDKSVDDVLRRADELMYLDKRRAKSVRAESRAGWHHDTSQFA